MLAINKTKYAPTKVPYEECQRFIQCMDLDGNESISKEEFETFVSRGLFMDDEQKKLYRERSDMHIHLVEFLGRIEEQVTAQEISEETSISFNGKDEKKIIDTTSEDTKKNDDENDKTTENSTDETIINVDETINQFEQEENAKKKKVKKEKKAAEEEANWRIKAIRERVEQHRNQERSDALVAAAKSSAVFAEMIFR